MFSIPDPIFFPSRISASNSLSILTPKIGFEAYGNMIRVVHPVSGSRIRIRFFTHPGSRGRRKEPDPGSGSVTLSFWIILLFNVGKRTLYDSEEVPVHKCRSSE
jgi:hypothetical protein